MRSEILQILYDEREKCFNVDLDKMIDKILQLFLSTIDSVEDEIMYYFWEKFWAMEDESRSASIREAKDILSIIKAKVGER
jgi:hypothetical protein